MHGDAVGGMDIVGQELGGGALKKASCPSAPSTPTHLPIQEQKKEEAWKRALGDVFAFDC